MNVHEYQAKSLLAGFGVAVPSGALVESSADIPRVVAEVGGPVWVVKAQIHAGGRGKGGGVIVTKSAAAGLSPAPARPGLRHRPGAITPELEGAKVHCAWVLPWTLSCWPCQM